MSERATMIHPPIEDLLDKVDSKFSLVSLAAKRGRQINSYFSQLGEGLGAIVPPQVASVSASHCPSPSRRSRPTRSPSCAPRTPRKPSSR